MNKRFLSVSLGLAACVVSVSALAARHHFEFIGEAYGHTSEEAIDNAWRVADNKCYLSWGQSDQDYTLLAEWIDPATGYPTARVSVGCTIDD